jgi:hypothetical protein
MERFEAGFEGEFQPLDQAGLFREMYQLLDALDLKQTIFRSDHASNYLTLKGTLGKDKEKLLASVGTAIERPDEANLRAEWQRGL